MPSTRRHSYDLNFKLKIVAEAEAVNNNREIAREYGISESMVRKWRKGVRQLNINTPPRMQISVHKKGWMDEEDMFYLHTVYSEKELFERATNAILGIRNCIVVMDIMLLSTCC